MGRICYHRIRRCWKGLPASIGSRTTGYRGYTFISTVLHKVRGGQRIFFLQDSPRRNHASFSCSLTSPRFHYGPTCTPLAVVVVHFHVRPVPRMPTEVPRRLTEETVRGDTAPVPLVTYDFLDFKIGPQVCFSWGLIVLLLHPQFVPAEALERYTGQ